MKAGKVPLRLEQIEAAQAIYENYTDGLGAELTRP